MKIFVWSVLAVWLVAAGGASSACRSASTGDSRGPGATGSTFADGGSGGSGEGGTGAPDPTLAVRALARRVATPKGLGWEEDSPPRPTTVAPDELRSSRKRYAIKLRAPWKVRPHGAERACGGGCKVSVWYDFVPRADLAHARKLIATESLLVTAAIRGYEQPEERRSKTRGHESMVLRFDGRTLLLVQLAAGTLVAQSMTDNPCPDVARPGCAASHALFMADFVAPFESSPSGALLATEDAKTEPLLSAREPPRPPTTVAAAIALLKEKLTKDEAAQIRGISRDDLVFATHRSLGMTLRNEWGLWGGSPLYAQLYGIAEAHPDDMSAALIEAFWLDLRGEPVELVKRAAQYEERLRPPTSLDCPRGEGQLTLEAPIIGERDANGIRTVVHVGMCATDGKRWHFELGKGWRPGS